MSSPVPQGTRLDKYEIRSPIGKGGMGEVYLAHDTELGRSVALKVLNSELTKNSEHLRRFMQEARATSSLNHPNILTVHDIGQVGSIHYIATEFIDGITLRQRLIKERLKLGEVLDILMQVCRALSAAHEAGYVHRDIKPENIMLRVDGYVKVLDFGLAKLMEPDRTHVASPEASTQINIHTDPQATVGTVDYMSPEQLRGQPADARSDMWSLGVMLYEMVAGCRPFVGLSKSDTISLILITEPAPLAEHTDRAPAELQSTVTKLLRQDKDGRFQTAKELLSDLKYLKQTLESEEQMARSQLRVASSGAVSRASSSDGRSTAEDSHASPLTAEIPTAHTTSTIENLFSEVKRHKTVALVVLAILLIGLGGIGYRYLTRSHQPARIATRPPQEMKFSRLRAAGNVIMAAISPDGKYVATIVEDQGMQSIWVRQIDASSNVPLIQPSKTDYRGLTFSPDSGYVYFLKTESDRSVLYQTTVLVGLPPRKLLEDVQTAVTFSPDGKRLAFIRQYQQEHATALMIASADGSGERRLATRVKPEFFDLGGPQVTAGPAWSPDGKVIVCPTLSVTEPISMNLVEVRVEDGAMKQINKKSWVLIGRVFWLTDGNGLVFNATDQAIAPPQVWRLSYSDGSATRLTNDQNSYSSISMTKDSQTLVAVHSEQDANLWIASNYGSAEANSISVANALEVLFVTWSPAGKLIYSSNVGANPSLWMIDADGKNNRQITFDDQGDSEPTVSPNGRDIVFVSSRTGNSHLWRVELDGGNPKQLTSGIHEDQPFYSPDGRWILYHSFNSAGSGIWKLPADGGNAQQVIEGIAQNPTVSPDGRQIACYYRDAQADSPWRIRVIPFEGGASFREFAISPDVNTTRPGLRWTPDGRALTYVATSKGVSNIWNQSLNGGAPQQITHFEDKEIFSFSWATDGMRLACVRGSEQGSAVLIRGFNQ